MLVRKQSTLVRNSAMASNELEKRITQLEDIEAIKQLKALYCDICDDNHNPDRITKIFVGDGIWEGGDFGKAQGHDAIRKLFQGFQKLISFSQHNIFNPRIEIKFDPPGLLDDLDASQRQKWSDFISSQ